MRYRSKNSILGNEAGLSIVELMIMSAVAMTLALAIATMFSNMTKQQQNASTRANVTQLQLSVQSAASDPSTIVFSATKLK